MLSTVSSIALLKPSVLLTFFSLTSRPDENPNDDWVDWTLADALSLVSAASTLSGAFSSAFADSAFGFLGFAKIRLKSSSLGAA